MVQHHRTGQQARVETSSFFPPTTRVYKSIKRRKGPLERHASAIAFGIPEGERPTRRLRISLSSAQSGRYSCQRKKGLALAHALLRAAATATRTSSCRVGQAAGNLPLDTIARHALSAHCKNCMQFQLSPSVCRHRKLSLERKCATRWMSAPGRRVRMLLQYIKHTIWASDYVCYRPAFPLRRSVVQQVTQRPM